MKFSFERQTPSYQILSEDDIKAIHEATLSLMSDFGVRVFGDEAREIYKKAGCGIDETTGLIRFPKKLVNDAIISAPGSYFMCGRDPKHDFEFGSDEVFYTTFGTGLEIVDVDTGERKRSDSENLGNLARFVDAIPEINAFTTAVASIEAPVHVKDLYEAKAVFCNTTKHAILDAENGKNANLVIDIAAVIAGGRDKLRERPFLTLCVCPTSPLEITCGASEVIIETAKAGLPVCILSMGLVGGTTPATLAGTLVCNNAEILAGIVLAQLVNPGNPVMYASSTTIMDMIYTSSPVGSPEHGMFGAAVAQLGKYYKIPTKVGGTSADSKCMDAQAGHEKTLTGLMPTLAKTGLICGMGMLDTGLAISYEQLLIDAEFVRMFKRAEKGVKVNEDTLALEVIKAVGPAGNYLSMRHTLKHARNEISTTKLIDRKSYSAWEKEGKLDIVQRAKKEAKRILAEHEPGRLSPEAIKKIDEIIANAT